MHLNTISFSEQDRFIFTRIQGAFVDFKISMALQEKRRGGPIGWRKLDV